MNRVLYFLALLIVSWCLMTMTHELGHIIGGGICGGTLTDFDLLPWHLPYSIFEPDPMPLVTLWSGPILGIAVPVVIAIIAKRDWTWFVADFCIVANGFYIGTAWFSNDRFLDTPKLLKHGAQPVTILLFVLVTIGFGYIRFRQSCIRVLGKPRAFETKPTNEEKETT